MKRTYFASDFHLGVDAKLKSKDRELQIIRWLESIEQDAETIYLVGDIFDFWFEYKTVVPKGFVRLLGKLASMKDKGIQIELFIGNHDMWIFDYFEKELGIPTHRKPIERTIYQKKFLIGHGDGLGPGDKGYKILKKVFANPFCQWLFERLHPNFGIGLANFWSGKSRYANIEAPFWMGKEKEWLYQYADKKQATLEVDYFIFGHRHLTINQILSDGKCRYINLGEWLYTNSYGVFDGKNFEIEFFENEHGKIWQEN
ncbi:MAG: UDP-2,3-diacylglucosamine diphosphatase [Saprospiraceae bacterium]|nr:UDP-2,3-diacylglucosamine diphosphatase [Saprospiraceae bacterium]